MNPYADTAQSYLADGWSPITLPYGEKAAPPAGYTGHGGAYVTDAEVADWSRRRHNIALRLPETVLGIDVDNYIKAGKRKAGAATLAAAVTRLGKLPETWRSTARLDDPVSGIRFFRVPAGRDWADRLGDDVEIVHHGHRYAVVHPSLHPETNCTYEWFDSDGLPCLAPAVDELPPLPDAWVRELDRGSIADRAAKLRVTDSTVDDFLASLPDGPPCRVVMSRIETAMRELPGSRHDTVRNHMAALVRFGEMGHMGVGAALDTLEAAFAVEVGQARMASGEWDRMMKGAVALALGSPTPAADKGCCSTPADDFTVVTSQSAELFDASHVLAHIRTAAESRMLPPLALLGAILARVLASTPPSLMLPPVIGSAASLNLGVGLVGESGDGKSAAGDLADELLFGNLGDPFNTAERDYVTAGPGSGEGLIETFLEPVPGGTAGAKRVRPAARVLLEVDEIGRLKDIQDRKGSSMAAVLRSAMTGGDLTTSNADRSRRREVPKRTYRLTAVAGIQPTRADVLLADEDAGTPQRWLWLPAVNPDAPDAEPEWPGPLGWTSPVAFNAPLTYIAVPDEVAEQVRAARRARNRGERTGNDGHLLLTREKVAAALALLHGGTGITGEWWAAAGHLMAISQAVQAQCRSALREAHQIAANTKATTERRAVVAAEERVADDRRIKFLDYVVSTLKKLGDGEHTTKDLNIPTRLKPDDRHEMDEWFDAGHAAGRFVVARRTARSGSTARYLSLPGGAS